MRVSEDLQILCIPRPYWLAAVQATFFENKQTTGSGSTTLNFDGEQIDILKQELEKVDQFDLPESNTRTSSVTISASRNRAMTMSPTLNSPSIKIERESILNRLRSRKSLNNVQEGSSQNSTNVVQNGLNTATEK